MTYADDRQKVKQRREQREARRNYEALLEKMGELEEEVEAQKRMADVHPTLDIIPRKRTGTSEATAVVMASDWHIEETVTPATVNDLNAYSLAIAERRVVKFWQSALRLWQVMKRDIEIKTMIVWLGGDAISGNIHEELLEICSLQPIEAIIKAQEWMASGLEFLLKNTDCDIVVVCSPGNHSRITHKQRHATEMGNALEVFMYYNLAKTYTGKRMKFVISGGYHTYLNVYDQVLRFHHGHGFRYQGGVGGIYIPFNKAIAQWNKGRRADIDVTGH